MRSSPGDSKGQKTPLAYRVIWVIECEGNRVLEYRSRLLKRDAMLAQVGRGFLCVPIKFDFGGFRGASFWPNDKGSGTARTMSQQPTHDIDRVVPLTQLLCQQVVFLSILRQSAVYGFGIRKEFIQLRVDRYHMLGCYFHVLYLA